MVIYLLWHKPTGKCYVGQTVTDVRRRMANHRSDKRAISLIDMAIQKYGWDEFDFAIIETLSSIDDLNEAEKFWITHYDTMAPNGYNIMEGGKNGRHSEETRAKMRGPRGSYNVSPESLRRAKELRDRNGYKPQSPESNVKRGEALKGRPKSEETRQRMRASAHGRLLDDAKVWEIRKLNHFGISLSEIARCFDMSKSGVSMITSGRNWENVIFEP